MLVLRRVLAGCLLALTVLLLSAVVSGQSASAHPMPHSIVALDLGADSVTANLRIPVGDLSIASGIDLTGDDADSALAGHRADLVAYLTEHLRPVSADGSAWTVAVGNLALSQAEQTGSGLYREITGRAVLTPPGGKSLQKFVFHLDPVIHQVATHTILVTIRGAGDEVTEIGTVSIDSRTMTVAPMDVDLENQSSWVGFVAMARLGGHHLLEGPDHLLFLLVLLLPAPILATAGRWSGPTAPRTALARIARITVAFTLGHSAALAISALTRLVIPAQPVEALIAVSILIGAAHAVRPLFPGREALVACGFGLVHGMAFGFTLARMNLATGELALGLLGFNLGIEAMQLLVVALVLPSLIVLSRSPWYRPVRTTGAAIAGLAATGWLLDRLGLANAVAGTVNTQGPLVWWIVAGLALLAAGRLYRVTSSRTSRTCR